MKKEDFTDLVRKIREQDEFMSDLLSVGLEITRRNIDLHYDVANFLLTLLGFPEDNTLEEISEEQMFCRDYYISVIMGDNYANTEIIAVEKVYDCLIEELREMGNREE